MQFLDDAGDPLASGWLKFTVSGTTDTLKTTYSDSALSLSESSMFAISIQNSNRQ